MKIQVLGADCSTCKQLFETTKKVVKELNLDTEVEYIDDEAKMIEMGIMTSPALVVDGKAVLTGGGKTEDDVKNVLEGDSKKEEVSGGCSCCGGC